jgi:hypothetical protein
MRWQIVHASEDGKWIIHQRGQQDPMFEFTARLPDEKLSPQLETIGITDTQSTLSLNDILHNITLAKGPAFCTKYFKASVSQGKVLEALFKINLLRPKTLNEEFGTEKFEDTLHNIKEKNWKLPAFDKVFGTNSTEYMIKNFIVVQHGTFPGDFPTFPPGHHCFPNNADQFNGYPAIMLQKKLNTGHKALDSFDVMYFMSIETHIFIDTFRYPPSTHGPAYPIGADSWFCRAQLNKAKPNAQQFLPGEPGCWWIKLADFIDQTDIDPTAPVSADLILQVPCPRPRPSFAMDPCTSDPIFFAENLGGLQDPRERRLARCPPTRPPG